MTKANLESLLSDYYGIKALIDNGSVYHGKVNENNLCGRVDHLLRKIPMDGLSDEHCEMLETLSSLLGWD